jgi:predicted dehydrogenase
MIDILNMCFGTPRTVAAFHRRAIVPTNDDCTTSIIAYDEPVTATLASHYCTPPVHDLRVVGTEAIAEVHNRGRQLVFRQQGAEPEVHEYPKRLSMTAEFEIFARAVRHGDPVETDGRGGVYAVAVVEASNMSARENRFVEVAELLGDF